MTRVTMGGHELQFAGPQLGRLRDANDLLADALALRARLDEDGYLLIRGLHDRAKVAAAGDLVLDHLAEQGLLDAAHPRDAAIAVPGARGGVLARHKHLVGAGPFLSVVEGEPVMELFARLLGGPVVTYAYKWLRAVPPGANTGAHYDVVYMGRGTLNLFTCWTPFCDVTLDRGPLAVLVGSHRFDRLKGGYGRSDVDRDRTDGWYSRDPLAVVGEFGGQWQTTEFAMGDAILFGMFTMHGSLDNASGRFRISCDTRYQRADEPIDDRWAGAEPVGHSAAPPDIRTGQTPA